MEKYYTIEKHTQMLIYLLKKHGVRKIVVSPGATNVCLVGSLQQDSYFELYSSVDERSAAYIACGLAEESGEAVALSCTGATASRNYVPGLTEAFYRKLPVLAITATQHVGRVGHLIPQVIDRSNPMKDITKLSVTVPVLYSKEDEWAANAMINNALLELRRKGGGPVHINLTTTYSPDFSVKELPSFRVIRRIGYRDAFPKLEAGRIAIFVGAHKKWSDELTQAVDAFCAVYNGVVLCGQNSNYKGRYQIMASLVATQVQYDAPCKDVDLLIHIGEVSGSYFYVKPKTVWRVSPDGELRDTFQKLSYVFEMEEADFFSKLSGKEANVDPQHIENDYLKEWKSEYEQLFSKIPELPFSNIWIASQTAAHLPENSVIHLGILNSLRSWDYFKIPDSVLAYSNTGGFGIDGNISSLVGASLANSSKIYYGVVGDLAFFYDLNAIGNRHIGKNIRIMLINNGRGTEFRNYNHPAEQFGDQADAYMAAAGHFGKQSKELVRGYALALGFEYMTASSKEEYLSIMTHFLQPEQTEKPMLLEVFTDSKEESDALKCIQNLKVSPRKVIKSTVKMALGDKGVSAVKKLVKK